MIYRPQESHLMELKGFRFTEEPIVLEENFNIRKDNEDTFNITFKSNINCILKDPSKKCIEDTRVCVYCYNSRFLDKLSHQLPSKRIKFLRHQLSLRSNAVQFLTEVEELIMDNKDYLNKIEIGIRREYLQIIRTLKEEYSLKPKIQKMSAEETNKQDSDELEEIDVFVTYSWDSAEHKQLVLSFADYLRKKGFNSDIDRKKSQESTSTDFTKMMHQAITDYDKVIIVLSKGYKEKANSFKGGVGTEYGLIIKDIDDIPNKYILLSFENISKDIFPANFKDREVIDLTNKDNHNVLFAKLQEMNLIEFSPVAKTRPAVIKEKIPDFEELIEQKSQPEQVNETDNRIKIESIICKPLAGSLKSSGKYFETHHKIVVTLKNLTGKVLKDFTLELIVPENLAKYDPKLRTENDTKIYSLPIEANLYSEQTIEVEIGHLIILNTTAEIAFNENLRMKIYSENGVISKDINLSELLYVNDYPNFERKI